MDSSKWMRDNTKQNHVQCCICDYVHDILFKAAYSLLRWCMLKSVCVCTYGLNTNSEQSNPFDIVPNTVTLEWHQFLEYAVHPCRWSTVIMMMRTLPARWWLYACGNVDCFGIEGKINKIHIRWREMIICNAQFFSRYSNKTCCRPTVLAVVRKWKWLFCDGRLFSHSRHASAGVIVLAKLMLPCDNCPRICNAFRIQCIWTNHSANCLRFIIRTGNRENDRCSHPSYSLRSFRFERTVSIDMQFCCWCLFSCAARFSLLLNWVDWCDVAGVCYVMQPVPISTWKTSPKGTKASMPIAKCQTIIHNGMTDQCNWN